MRELRKNRCTFCSETVDKTHPGDKKGLENIAHDSLKLEVNEYLKANSPRYAIKDLRNGLS